MSSTKQRIAALLPPDFTKEKLLQLWGKVLKRDKAATQEMVTIYRPVFPHNVHLTQELNQENLHMMFLHLEWAVKQ